MATTPHLDLAHNTNFQFVIPQLPTVKFSVLKAEIPAISLAIAEQPTPFKIVPRIGDAPEYAELNIEFHIDEIFSGYQALHRWILANAVPESYEQFQNDPAFTPTLREGEDGGLYADGTLTILSNKKNPILEIVFSDLFPTQLGSVEFNLDSHVSLKSTCTFAYDTYAIRPLSF